MFYKIEWWGVEEGILQKGKFFSSFGYTTLIPDLYRGKVATDHEEAGHRKLEESKKINLFFKIWVT